MDFMRNTLAIFTLLVFCSYAHADLTFPDVPQAMVGNTGLKAGGAFGCSATIHDLYHVIAEDGQKYRTWHALWHPKGVSKLPTMDQIIKGKNDPACYFAHEHGDPPLGITKPGTGAPLPAFGYAGLRAMGSIEAHAGFKVVTHVTGQVTGWHRPPGWNSPEKVAVNPDWDFQIHFHQGAPSMKTSVNAPGSTRVTQHFHELSLWVKDGRGHITHVQGMADTGRAMGNSGCGAGASDGNGRRLLSDGCFVSPPNIYENWSFFLGVGDSFETSNEFDVFNTMDFLSNPAKQAFGSSSETICGNETQRSSCAVKRPFGDPMTPATAFMSTSRNVLMASTGSWIWTNASGSYEFCTDGFGAPAACGSGTIKQKVAQVNASAGMDGPHRTDDSSHFPLAFPFIDGYLRMPQGAPLGN